MISPVVEAVDDGTDLYGVTADTLQSDIVIGEDKITGVLKYVEEYEGFNPSKPEEQSGNYLALDFRGNEDVTVTTEIIGGTNKAPVDVTDDFCVYRIADKNTQSIKVNFTKGETTETKTYSLTELDCRTE